MAATVNPVARIFNLVKLEQKEISSIYFYAILNGLIQLSLPVGIQAIIGFVLGGSMVTSLVVLISLVVLGVFLSGVLQIGQMQIIEKIQQKIFIRYTWLFAERIPKLDMKKTDAYYLPEMVNRFFEIPSLQKGLAKLLLDIPTATIQIFFGLALLSLYHPAFILFGMVLVFILWLILYYTGNRGLQSSLSESAYKYATGAWLEELARSIKTFKFSKGSQISTIKADENASGYLQSRNEHFSTLQFQFKVLIGFKVLITASMLIVGSMLLINQQLNIGQFIAAEIVILTVISSVEKLIGNLDSVYDVLTSVDKIAKITDKPTEPDGNYALPPAREGLSIEAKGLCFGYHEHETILDDISFAIRKGEKICITGGEGGGKSTLLKLLTGAYNEFEGAININGLPIGNYQLASLRSQTGILLHQQDIFHGSLLENVTMGNNSIDIQEILELFQIAGLNDFLSTRKDGLDTWLDPTGRRLPRNVIQKILLVRALSGKPRLLLLEEPWLGIEEPYKQQIKDLLLHQFSNCTIITVTNDADFANACDHVIEINNKKIINRK